MSDSNSSGLRITRFRLLTSHLLNTALDFVFPPRCIACGRPGSLFCTPCQAAITPPAPLRAAGSPLAEQRATADFDGPIRQAIHALKYRGQRRFALPLATRLQSTLECAGWQPGLLTAAPLSESRRRERGYNQAALLAAELSRRVGIPFRPDALRKVRDTRPQVGLNAGERRANVAGAFCAEPDLVSGVPVLIIDDVFTTGATLRECAAALLAAGATTVWGLTVASARLGADDTTSARS